MCSRRPKLPVLLRNTARSWTVELSDVAVCIGRTRLYLTSFVRFFFLCEHCTPARVAVVKQQCMITDPKANLPLKCSMACAKVYLPYFDVSSVDRLDLRGREKGGGDKQRGEEVPGVMRVNSYRGPPNISNSSTLYFPAEAERELKSSCSAGK